MQNHFTAVSFADNARHFQSVLSSRPAARARLTTCPTTAASVNAVLLRRKALSKYKGFCGDFLKIGRTDRISRQKTPVAAVVSYTIVVELFYPATAR